MRIGRCRNREGGSLPGNIGSVVIVVVSSMVDMAIQRCVIRQCKDIGVYHRAGFQISTVLKNFKNGNGLKYPIRITQLTDTILSAEYRHDGRAQRILFSVSFPADIAGHKIQIVPPCLAQLFDHRFLGQNGFAGVKGLPGGVIIGAFQNIIRHHASTGQTPFVRDGSTFRQAICVEDHSQAVIILGSVGGTSLQVRAGSNSNIARLA